MQLYINLETWNSLMRLGREGVQLISTILMLDCDWNLAIPTE